MQDQDGHGSQCERNESTNCGDKSCTVFLDRLGTLLYLHRPPVLRENNLKLLLLQGEGFRLPLELRLLVFADFLKQPRYPFQLFRVTHTCPPAACSMADSLRTEWQPGCFIGRRGDSFREATTIASPSGPVPPAAFA